MPAAPVSTSRTSKPGLGLRLRAPGPALVAAPELDGFHHVVQVGVQRCERWEIDRDTTRAPNLEKYGMAGRSATVGEVTHAVVLERRRCDVPSRVGQAAVAANLTRGWQLRASLEGEIVFLAASRPALERAPAADLGRLMATSPTARVLALVGCLPMLLTPSVVQAAPPTLPPRGDVDDPTSASAAPPESMPSSGEGETAAPSPAPAPAPPSSGTEDAVSLTGVGLWAQVVGQRVRITVQAAEGVQDVEGELISQSADLLALSVDDDGRVVTVRKADVLAAHVDGVSKAEKWGQTGAGLLIGGGVMIGVGVPLIISAISFGTYGFYGRDVALGFGIPGALLVAGGIPMVVFGAKRQKEHRRQFGFASARPNLRVRKDGAVAGVSLRF